VLAYLSGYLEQAPTFQKGAYTIGIGMWLALIMAFNVWFIIWPNQRKVPRRLSGRQESGGADCQADLAHHTSTPSAPIFLLPLRVFLHDLFGYDHSNQLSRTTVVSARRTLAADTCGRCC
jgi:uncharacterized membrane protein